MQKYKGRQYFLKIVSLMLFFDLILLVPLSVAFYRISSRKMLDSITAENQNTLHQLEYYYEYNRQITAGICLNIYNSTTAQQLLYNRETDYFEMYLYMQELRNMKYSMYSSIDTVVVYNSAQDTFYSSEAIDGYDGSTLRSFVETQHELPILQPILRETTTRRGAQEIIEPVFSYFIYENGRGSGSPSFIMINQNAGWLIDALQNYQKTKQKEANIYYCDDAGMIHPLKNDMAETEDQALLLKLWSETDGELGAYFSRECKDESGNQYLVSGVQVGVNADRIILIQKYDVIFEDLAQLRDSIVHVALIAGVLSVLFLLLISSRMYKPVDNLLVSLVDGGKDSAPSGKESEFEWIEAQFMGMVQKNKKLSSANSMYDSVTSQYLLMRYIVQHDKNSIQNFHQNYPDHWLAKEKPAFVYMYLLQINNIGSNRYFNASDSGTVLYAINNMIFELIPDEYKYASFTSGDSELCILLGHDGTQNSEALSACLLECKKLIREHLGLTVSIAGVCGENKEESLHDMWRQAAEYLQYRYVYGHQLILDKDRCRGLQKNMVAHYPSSMDDELGKALYRKDLPSAEVALVKIYHLIQTYHYRTANICVMSMITKISTVLNAMIEQKQLPETTDVLTLYSIAIHSEDLGDLFGSVKKYLYEVLQARKEADGSESVVSLPDAVVDYVQEHYANMDLSLQTIADHFHQSSRSISKEFKDSTGMTINEYITKTRMSVAAHLLRYTDLSINEIVSKIGLENSNYFYKLFKKTYQCTPREFTDEKYNAAPGSM